LKLDNENMERTMPLFLPHFPIVRGIYRVPPGVKMPFVIRRNLNPICMRWNNKLEIPTHQLMQISIFTSDNDEK